MDASCLLGPRSGIGNYAANSVAELMRLLPETEFRLFLGYGWARALPAEESAKASAVSAARRLPVVRKVWRMLRGRRFVWSLHSNAPDVVYAPNYLAPAPCDPVVPVVYDLSHVRMPEAHPPDRVAWLRNLDAALARAAAVVTISRFSKREIVDVYGVSPDKLVVAPPGVGSNFRPVAGEARRPVLQRHGLDERRYFLAVGNLEPRKNLTTLIEAYARLPGAVRDRYPLVVGGGAGWGEAGVTGGSAARLRRAGQLRLSGYLPSADLPALYAGAAAFCFPSLYEGFGIPVIEALACGAAVLASNATAIPEAAGEAGLLLDPRDLDAWTRGLQRIIEDEALAETLRARGPQQVARFTWTGCAGEILRAFARCAGRAPGGRTGAGATEIPTDRPAAVARAGG
ncbi:MAG: glycosyltransferase family 4 protein [Kiloniellaceae bacterium]